MTEEYVSFEIAKLLKEKGFYQCYYDYPVYWMNGSTPTLSFEGDVDFPFGDNECCAPSQAVAMRWLREFHNRNIILNMIPDEEHSFALWTWNVCSNKCSKILWGSKQPIYTTYEEACNDALLYTLTNLI